MTDRKEHMYHHKYCAECQRYTVHDAGKCTVCSEKDDILEKLAKNEEKPSS